jgi:hypothetical protein
VEAELACMKQALIDAFERPEYAELAGILRSLQSPPRESENDDEHGRASKLD